LLEFDPDGESPLAPKTGTSGSASGFSVFRSRIHEYGETAVLARLHGFSLHAATVCEAHQHNKLERLCRYITRPPIATRRLSVDGLSRVSYRYKRPFRDG